MDEDYNSRVEGKKVLTLMTCGDENIDTCRPTLGYVQKDLRPPGFHHVGSVEAWLGPWEEGQEGIIRRRQRGSLNPCNE